MGNVITLENRVKKEGDVITLSIIISGIFFVLGIIVSLFTGSTSILMDGIASGLFVIIGVVSKQISKLDLKKPTKKFPMGYSMIQPLYYFIIGTLLSIIIAYIGYEHVLLVMSGGKNISLGFSTFFEIASGFICLGFYFYFKKKNREINSTLIKVEAVNMFSDGIISFAVGVAFLTGLLLNNTPLSFIVPYIDPVITLAALVYMVFQILDIMKDGVKSLLHMSPDEKTVRRIDSLILKFRHINPFVSNVGKTVVLSGKKILVLLNVEINSRSKDFPIEKLRELKYYLENGIKKIQDESTVHISFDFFIENGVIYGDKRGVEKALR